MLLETDVGLVRIRRALPQSQRVFLLSPKSKADIRLLVLTFGSGITPLTSLEICLTHLSNSTTTFPRIHIQHILIHLGASVYTCAFKRLFDKIR